MKGKFEEELEIRQEIVELYRKNLRACLKTKNNGKIAKKNK